MSRADEAGARAAATFFVTELYPYTVATHDTRPWLAMSHSLCSYCASIVDSVTAEEGSGTVTTPGTITVIETRVEEASPLTFGVKLEITVDHDVQRSQEGKAVQAFPAQHLRLGTIVVRQGDRWLVRGVEVFSSEDVR